MVISPVVALMCIRYSYCGESSGLQVAGISQHGFNSLAGCGGDQESCGLVLKSTGCVFEQSPMHAHL